MSVAQVQWRCTQPSGIHMIFTFSHQACILSARAPRIAYSLAVNYSGRVCKQGLGCFAVNCLSAFRIQLPWRVFATNCLSVFCSQLPRHVLALNCPSGFCIQLPRRALRSVAPVWLSVNCPGLFRSQWSQRVLQSIAPTWFATNCLGVCRS